MKRYILIFTLLSGLAIILSGCEKFLNIQPRGSLANEEMFSNIQGYRDAMYGVYGSMAGMSLYGENLSFGFADKIGQMLLNPNSELSDLKIANYDYTDLEVRPVIDAIWSSQYAVISYINNILANAETTEISHEDLNLIRGEAYGVRALLHFDLIRLFAPDYRQNPDATGIPYAYTYDLENKKLYSLKECFQNVLSDLDEAERLLADDPLDLTDISESTGPSAYRMSRYVHFNRLAVQALRARVYQTMGDYQNAAKYAKMVIDENGGILQLVRPADFRVVRRFPSHGELIFGLFTRALNDQLESLFLGEFGSGSVSEARRDLGTLYETNTFSASNTDTRYSLYYREELGGGLFVRLLASSTEKQNDPLTGVTLIRLPEMYLILAEAQYRDSPQEAVETLNRLRASRGLEGRSVNEFPTEGEFDDELLRAYMREFPGEGQVFYAFKHFNIPLKAFNGVDEILPSSEVFVLPWPEMEMEYGSIGTR